MKQQVKEGKIFPVYKSQQNHSKSVFECEWNMKQMCMKNKV